MCEQQRDIHHLESEVEKTTASLTKTERESTESRQLWENEVKSKSKLGQKIMELEKSQEQNKKLVDQVKKGGRE